MSNNASRLFAYTLGFLLIVAAARPAAATPTSVVVHVIARDAKIMGSHVGGARITIRNSKSGRLLAEGVQMGETGDTAKIMKLPHVRGESIFTTPNAAAFATTLDIDEPTTIEIAAEGPLKYPQAMQRAVKTMRILPGQNMSGDGVVLELHGLVIDLLAPEASVAAGDLAVKMKVMMMCGCPVDPDGIWDAARMQVVVRLRSRRGILKEVTATPVGSSTFTATIPAVGAGRYTLEILASDPAAANFGTFAQNVKVTRAVP